MITPGLQPYATSVSCPLGADCVKFRRVRVGIYWSVAGCEHDEVVLVRLSSRQDIRSAYLRFVGAAASDWIWP